MTLATSWHTPSGAGRGPDHTRYHVATSRATTHQARDLEYQRKDRDAQQAAIENSAGADAATNNNRNDGGDRYQGNQAAQEGQVFIEE